MVVAGPVVDFVEGVIQQFHAAFALGRALVDFTLVERDYQQDECLRHRRDSESPKALRSLYGEAVIRWDKHIQDEQLAYGKRNQATSPTR